MTTHRKLAMVMAAVMLGAVTLPLGGGPALACACCAEPGARYDREDVIDDYSHGVLKALRFAVDAHLYSTEADWSEQVKGIANPSEATAYRLTATSGLRTLTFEIADKAGHKGMLQFRMPARLRKFHVDTKPEVRKAPGYVPTVLYKEWRLDGAVTGSGIFAFKDMVPAQLILHGTGNGCTSADQFTNWTLDVNGPAARFRFFGRLSSITQ